MGSVPIHYFVYSVSKIGVCNDLMGNFLGPSAASSVRELSGVPNYPVYSSLLWKSNFVIFVQESTEWMVGFSTIPPFLCMEVVPP